MVYKKIKNNKYIFCKEGVYFALTREQLLTMNKLTTKLIIGGDTTGI